MRILGLAITIWSIATLSTGFAADARGPSAIGRWVDVPNAAGTVAALVAPVLTGILADRTGLFDVAFGLAAAVNVLGFIG